MQFRDLLPGDLFTFHPLLGGAWSDLNVYRKAGNLTYHRVDKILLIRTVESTAVRVTPEAADAFAYPEGSRKPMGHFATP